MQCYTPRYLFRRGTTQMLHTLINYRKWGCIWYLTELSGKKWYQKRGYLLGKRVNKVTKFENHCWTIQKWMLSHSRTPLQNILGEIVKRRSQYKNRTAYSILGLTLYQFTELKPLTPRYKTSFPFRRIRKAGQI